MSRINTQSLFYDNYFKAICNKSVKHNYIYFYLSMTTCFGLQRPSSGHQYKTSKIRQNTVWLYSQNGIPSVLQ